MSRQGSRQLVPTLEWQANLFDGGELQIGLGGEALARSAKGEANVAGS